MLRPSYWLLLLSLGCNEAASAPPRPEAPPRTAPDLRAPTAPPRAAAPVESDAARRQRTLGALRDLEKKLSAASSPTVTRALKRQDVTPTPDVLGAMVKEQSRSLHRMAPRDGGQPGPGGLAGVGKAP